MLRLISLLAFVSAAALAQFSGNIQGMVQDQSSAVVPSATVRLKNLDNGVESAAATSAVGAYRFSSLAPGRYEVTAEAAGFQPRTIALQLLTAQTAGLNFTLTVSSASERVQVVAEAPVLDTAEMRIQATLGKESLEQLPLFGRNFMTLAAIAPGVTGVGLVSGGSSGNTMDNFAIEKFVDASGNGRNYSGNLLTVDGLNVTSNIIQGVSNLSPNPDSVQEVAIQTNTFSAEHGKASSIQVAVTTKSGTNDFHGTGSYFFNNQDLQARSVFTTVYAPFRKHDIAATLGGPVIRNRTFFFSSVETLRSKVSSAGAVQTFESPEFVTWAKRTFPNSLGTKMLTDYPVANVAGTGVARRARDVLGADCGTPAAFGLPCDTPMILTGQFTPSTDYNGLQYNFRGDQYLRGGRDRVYLNYYHTDLDRAEAPTRASLNSARFTNSAAWQANWTHTFTPALLNEFSFGLMRIDGSVGVGNAPFRIPNTSITGQNVGISLPGPYKYIQNNYNWRDVVSWVRGSHTFKFGFEAWSGDDDGRFAGQGARPSFSFNNLLDLVQDKPFSQGSVVYDFLSGKVAKYDYRYVMKTFGAFVQDDWKVKPNLTLTFGLRWDDYGVSRGDEKTVLSNIILGSGSNTDERFANAAVRVVPGLYNGRLNKNFSPRLGVAWDPTREGRWSVRGGIGLYHDWIPLGEENRVRSNPPAFTTPTLRSDGAIKPVYSIGASDEYPYGFKLPDISIGKLDERGGIAGSQVSVGGVDPGIKAPSTLNYVIGVERLLPSKLIAGANYSGSQTWDSVIGTDFNRFAGDLLDGRLDRVNPSFGTMMYEFNKNRIRYNAIILTLRGQLGGRGSFQASYTLSKVTDYGQMGSRVNRDNGGYPSQHKIESYKSWADWDVRNRFSLSGSYRIPAPSRQRVLDSVLGGWELSTVAIIQSGLPFSVVNRAAFQPMRDASGKVTGYRPGSGDYNADGTAYDFPNAPSKDFTGSHSRQEFIRGLFSQADFPAPEPGSDGNLKRDIYRNPGFLNLDTSMIKNNRLPWFGERGNLQLRFEFFNVLNRVNLSGVDSSLTSATFGRSTSTFSPRTIQLAARIVF